jgi:hypothetical protein
MTHESGKQTHDHQTLRVTPTEAGIVDHVGSIQEIVGSIITVRKVPDETVLLLRRPATGRPYGGLESNGPFRILGLLHRRDYHNNRVATCAS